MEQIQSYRYRYWEESLTSNPLISAAEARDLAADLSLYDMMALANSLTSAQVGDVVSYAVSYNINYSNYCAASCPICAFYVPMKIKGKTDRGYELSRNDIRNEMQKAKAIGATEIHIV